MISLRTLVPLALLVVAAQGCKDDPPTAKPEPTGSSAASSRAKLATRSPVPPVAKVDPQTMKEYRVDVCYFGSQTLRQARDTYLASLGGAEPGEKKIPSFGAPPGPAPAGSGAPAAGSAAPKSSAAPAASGKAAGSAHGRVPLPSLDPSKRPFDVAMRAPHERNARACTAAAALKEPSMGDLDKVLSEYAPFAVELAKNVSQATNYYQREEFKKDSFAKGKELHKKLTDDFKKLDEMSAKLGEAVAAWSKGHPIDVSKMEEGQKPAMEGLLAAREIVLSVVKKPDPAAIKEQIGKAEKSLEALKAFGTGHAQDPWAKIMTPALETFVKTAKDLEPKMEKLEPDQFLSVITSFTALVESKHRALTRSLVAKQQGDKAAAGGSAAPAAPAPGAADDDKDKDEH